ncbi:MOSC domain-containing protein [Plasticicumulans sp.]|uniref:MOSC domain-containing protein n=1 Tax=Plasticicumulans sp. TaxID=2307179 RepID=UPI0039648494
MTDVLLSALYRYPVKSCRGARLDAAMLDRYGIAGDRHWMLVEAASGRFVTQRQHARMALIDTQWHGDTLGLSVAGAGGVEVTSGIGEPRTVEVWGEVVQALDAGDEAAAWLSEYLGLAVRLVECGPAHRRPVDPAYDRIGAETGFSDGFPLLLISEASLADLNSRMERPVEMIRFRPNLVVSGCAPFAEDGWKRLRIGGIELHVVKPCSRCPIPTIDPATAARGREPMATLLKYRREGQKTYFGQNLIHAGPGELQAGMRVEVLE